MRRNTTAHTQAGTSSTNNATGTSNAIVGSAVSLESHAPTVQARASLAIRIIMIAIAVIALAFAVLTGLNISASARFNQATASLNSNLKQAARSDADLDALNASQQQTDAQFEDTARLNLALLPQLREAISANAAVSSKLTQRIKQELAAQQGGNSANSGSDTNGVEGGNGAKDSTANDTSGLTDEQKKQVEELLKANQQSTDTTPSTNTQTDKGNKKQQTAKPW